MGRSALPKGQLQLDAWLGRVDAEGLSAPRSMGRTDKGARKGISKAANKGAVHPQASSSSASKATARTRAGQPAARSGTLPGSVRIIGGQWKRRKLPVAQRQGIPAGLRPTADRVRETVFNWLGQDLSGWRCVDVCAGTGALGFEAASRGAVQVIMVEQHPAVLQHLHAACKQLDAQNVQIVAGDAVQFLHKQAKQALGSVDVVFFDPPYAEFSSQACAQVLRLAASLLVPDGRLYLESGREWLSQELGALGWERWRYLKAGAVHAHLLRPLPSTHPQPNSPAPESPIQGVEI